MLGAAALILRFLRKATILWAALAIFPDPLKADPVASGREVSMPEIETLVKTTGSQFSAPAVVTCLVRVTFQNASAYPQDVTVTNEQSSFSFRIFTRQKDHTNLIKNLLYPVLDGWSQPDGRTNHYLFQQKNNLVTKGPIKVPGNGRAAVMFRSYITSTIPPKFSWDAAEEITGKWGDFDISREDICAENAFSTPPTEHFICQAAGRITYQITIKVDQDRGALIGTVFDRCEISGAIGVVAEKNNYFVNGGRPF